MHALNIQLEDWNHTCILRLSRNLFCILQNIPTIVGIMYRGHGCECTIYVFLIVIDVRIHTNYCCGGGGRYKSMRAREDIVKFIAWLLIQMPNMF